MQQNLNDNPFNLTINKDIQHKECTNKVHGLRLRIS
jgi:hypothetical protein